MRLSLNRTLDPSATRGIQKFGSILLTELRDKFGVKLVGAKEKSDIHLTIIQGGRKPGAKNILRLDGVYYDVGRMKMNNPIKKTLTQSDGVIYQSKWAQRFVEGMLKAKPRSSIVIHNGAKTSSFQSAAINKYQFDKVMICCAGWRVNKRLKYIVESFLACREITGLNLGLFVVGKPDYTNSDPSVKFFGKVVENIHSVYASSDYMCHICHLDACPNAVVEALCCGIPVLSNNIGGTPEIVGSDGIISELDKPFDFRVVPSMAAVAPISSKILTKDMVRLVSQNWKINRPDLDISVSAKKYYEYFMKILQ